MQLNCPNCGEQIAAENINIQRMVAVCSACDTVFSFDPPGARAKRRKVKQPRRLETHETDQLRLMFRTNFRLEKNEGFISGVFGSIGLTFMAAIMTSEYLADGKPPLLLFVFGIVLAALCFYYWLALLVFNKTHIEMDDDTISVSRKPLPNIFAPTQEINLSGVTAFRSEETAKSIKEGYDTPRYRVWAETVDGGQKMIVNDVIEEYGSFIAQRLNERLHEQADLEGLAYSDAGQNLTEDADEKPAYEVERRQDNNNKQSR